MSENHLHLGPYYASLDEAQARHKLSGGYLLDVGGGYLVTDDNPAEHRSFDSICVAIDYAFRLAEADYDETEMMPESCPPIGRDTD